MKNLNPRSGLRQLSTGKIYIPRRIILELIRNKHISVSELGYFLITLISTDWNEGEYRYGYIRHEIKDLAKIWNISYNTLYDNLNSLLNSHLLDKESTTFRVNDFDYFQKAHAYKNVKYDDRELEEFFANVLISEISEIKTEIPSLNNEISNFNLSIRPKLLNVSPKVVINIDNTRTIADYQKIYKEGNYTTLLPDDMKWLDEHVTEDGRTIW